MKKSIHTTSWPEVEKSYVSEDDIKLGDEFVAVVGAVRKFKSEKQVSMKTELKELVIECSEATRKFIEDSESDMKAVTGAREIKFGKAKIETDSNDVKVSN